MNIEKLNSAANKTVVLIFKMNPPTFFRPVF